MISTRCDIITFLPVFASAKGNLSLQDATDFKQEYEISLSSVDELYLWPVEGSCEFFFITHKEAQKSSQACDGDGIYDINSC